MDQYANEVIHLELVPSKWFGTKSVLVGNVLQYRIRTPSWSWFLTEAIVGFMLLQILVIRKKAFKVDLINFHIAYPNLTYWYLLKRWIQTPVLITEHWSAYHMNFGVRKPLPRVQRIFRQGIPVITVSKALKDDIERFARGNIKSFVVPNIVDQEVFYPDPTVQREQRFFMVSKWSYPKKPIVILEAFKEFQLTHTDYTLIIGGYGDQWQDIENWVEENNLADCIELVGVLSQTEVADNLRSCSCFIHSSTYETFSAVCAEAVSCHTPVIAPAVGGIPEVVGNAGILLDQLDKDNLHSAMNKIVHTGRRFKGDASRFSISAVAEDYSNVIERTIKDTTFA